MPINQNEIVDLLFKKVAYSASKTNTELGRAPSEEPIPSPVSTFGNYIWLAAGSIPTNPPTSDTSIVERRQSTGYVELTRNTDVANNRSWIAQESANGTITSLRDWIPPIFGAQYGIKVWTGTPGAGGAARIYPKGSGQDDEFYFDYDAGTLHFIGNTVPVSSGTQISVEGYRYIGSTDIGTVSASKLNDLTDVEIESGNVNLGDGQVLVYDLASETWINGPIPSGALDAFSIVNPIEGEVLVFQQPGGDNKFENKKLNYFYIDGFPPIDSGEDSGSFVQVNESHNGFQYTSLTDLYLPGDLIEIAGNTLNHEPAAEPVIYTGTAAGGAVVVTSSSGEDQESSGWYPAHIGSSDLYLMKTCELDTKGHVVAREWINISNQFNLYTTLDTYNARWDQHTDGTQQEHNLWLNIAGVSADFASGSGTDFDGKLLVKQGDDLITITHPNIVIGDAGGSLGVTEVHATHLFGELVDPSMLAGGGGTAPQDGETLVYNEDANDGNGGWESTPAGDVGEANEGLSLTGTDVDAFDIFKQKDNITLQFRGLEFFDANSNSITTHGHTWSDGVDPVADFPLTAAMASTDDRIEIQFDPSKIRLYQLTDQMSPESIGYSTFQLDDLRNDPPNNPGGPDLPEKQYEANWFSYDPNDPNDLTDHLTDKPNRMSQAQWGALQGGGGQGDTGTSRELRVNYHLTHLEGTNTTNPLSIQQQIDDKVQYRFFKQHMTLGDVSTNGNQAEEIFDINFGGYHNQLGEYGYPGIVTTTTGEGNPIYQGPNQAHESKSIIFRANAISHYNQAAYGDIFDHTVEQFVGGDWFDQGITPWQQTGGQHLRYHTVRSVVTKHINTHVNNPHGVLFSDVENDVAHWNANQLLGNNIQFSTLANNHVLLWDDANQEWINSDVLTTTGESNAAGNIGGGLGEFFSSKAGTILQFRTLESISSSLIVATDTPNDRVTIDFSLPPIDIDSLVGWPIQFEDVAGNKVLNELSDIDTTGVVDNQILIYDADTTKWRSGNPGLTGVDLAGVEEGDYLIAEEVVPNVTPAEFKWVRSSKYTIGGSLAGVADQNGDRIAKPVSVDYDPLVIGNNHVLAYDSANQEWKAQALGSGYGESNLLSDYSASPTINAVGLAVPGEEGKAGTTLFVKSISTDPTLTVVADPTYTHNNPGDTDKVIALKVIEGNLSLGNIGGYLEPVKIEPGTVDQAAFGALAGYSIEGPNENYPDKGFINGAINTLIVGVADLETDKAESDDLDEHVDIDTALSYGGYGPSFDANLKHQPYEIGSYLPEFNADKLAHAPLHANLMVIDNGEEVSALGPGDGGQFLKWDGFAWDIGGGGEVAEGVHTQFAFYHALDPEVSTATRTLAPTGSEFVFIQTPNEAAKLGVQTTDPPEVFSIGSNSGARPCIATEQIANVNQEPSVTAGWGKLYGRASVGGIFYQTKVVLHFDGVDGGSSFLNDGRAPVFFLPKHDYDDGQGEVYNQAVTKTDKYIYGNSAGYFPAPTGTDVGTNYLAGNAHDDIILGGTAFGFDFWMYPTDVSGTQKIAGQYDDADNYWYLAVKFHANNPHEFEFKYKKELTTWTRTLQVSGGTSFVSNSWYHVIFQRYPDESIDVWELLVSSYTSQQTGAPTIPSTGEGLPHGVTKLQNQAHFDIDELQGPLIVGNGNREGTDPGFVGYMDEFRMLVGEYTDHEGSTPGADPYLTFLLPYDKESSSLIYKDSKGTHNLLDSGAIVRRLRDQDGNTTVDVDKDDLNDEHIRFSANGIEVATFSQNGLNLANSTPVTRVENNLNNNYSYALVTQEAIKNAFDNISGDSIQDAAGTTYIRTEQGSQDEIIRMAVGDDEKLAINADGVDLKAKLYLDSVAPAAGQILKVGSNQKLSWEDPLNVATGTTETLTTYTNNGKDLGPATGVSWDPTADILDIDGGTKSKYTEMVLYTDTANYPSSLGSLDSGKLFLADGKASPVDEFTSLLFHFDDAVTKSGPHSNHVVVDTLKNAITGNALTVTHTNTDSGNLSLHGQGFTTSSKFGDNALFIGWFDEIRPDTNQEIIDAFDFGSEDFTVDFWYNARRENPFGNINNLYNPNYWLGIPGILYFFSYGSGTHSGEWRIALSSSSYYFVWPSSSVNGHQDQYVWNHIALVRSGDTLSCFVNGIPCDAGQSVTGLTVPTMTTADVLDFGGMWSATNNQGQCPSIYLDEFRISKGIARWTEGFNLPDKAYGLLEEVPDVKLAGKYNTVSLVTEKDLTSAINALPASSDEILLLKNRASHPSVVSDYFGIYSIEAGLSSEIKLLLQGDGVDGSNSILDSSLSEHQLTVSGPEVEKDAGINATRSAFGSSCIKFTSGNYLEIPSSDDFDFGGSSEDFTIHMWVYFNDFNVHQVLANQWSGDSNHVGDWQMFFRENGSIQQQNLEFFYRGSSWASAVTTNTAVLANTWTHIAVVRSSGVIRFYFDGVEDSVTITNASQIGDSSKVVRIGKTLEPSHVFKGYLDEVVFIKGTAIDFSSTGKPTAELDAGIPAQLYTQDSTGNQTQLTGVASGWTDATSGVVKLSDSADIIELGEKVDASALPTSAPATSGRLWNDSGTLKITT